MVPHSSPRESPRAKNMCYRIGIQVRNGVLRHMLVAAAKGGIWTEVDGDRAGGEMVRGMEHGVKLSVSGPSLGSAR